MFRGGVLLTQQSGDWVRNVSFLNGTAHIRLTRNFKKLFLQNDEMKKNSKYCVIRRDT